MNISQKSLNLYEKALDFYYKNEYESALELFYESLRIEPNFAEAMSYLGNVHRFLEYKKMSKDDVFNLLEKAMKINPGSAIVWKNMGIGYAEIKSNLDKAMECYKEAIKIDPHVRLDLNIGSLYFQKGDFDAAIEYFKKVEDEDPQYQWALYNMGVAFQEKKSYKKAIDLFEKVVELDPYTLQNWMILIGCYILNQDLSSVFKIIDRAELIHSDIFEFFISGFSESVRKELNYKRELYEIFKSSKKATNKDDAIKILKEGQRLMVNKIDLDVLIKAEEENPDFFSTNYGKFREIQKELKSCAIKYSDFPDLKNISNIDLSTNFKEFVLSFSNGNITYPSKEIRDKYSELLSEILGILHISSQINIIPYSIQKKIKQILLKLGVRFNRLKIEEIAEKCEELEDCVILIALDMIENKEINAEYFRSTRTLAFDQRTNTDEINSLMKKFDDWELKHCNNCGNKISGKKQRICEYCGKEL